MLVFDDISWSEGMERAWNALAVDGRIRVSIDLGKHGVCIVADALQEKYTLKIALY